MQMKLSAIAIPAGTDSNKRPPRKIVLFSVNADFDQHLMEANDFQEREQFKKGAKLIAESLGFELIGCEFTTVIHF